MCIPVSFIFGWVCVDQQTSPFVCHWGPVGGLWPGGKGLLGGRGLLPCLRSVLRDVGMGAYGAYRPSDGLQEGLTIRSS